MSRIDLFQLARANAERLAEQCAGHSLEAIAFAEWIAERSTLSVTMNVDRLQTFLGEGRYFNPWDECARTAKDEKDLQDKMRQKQGIWYTRRVRFDDAFVNGRKFCYGALYVSGSGLLSNPKRERGWGPFCALFRRNAVAACSSLAWLPGNSLELYFSDQDAADFNLTQLTRDVASHACRHHLAAIKHAAEIGHQPDSDWPSMILHYMEASAARDAVWIEGIVADDLLVAHVERILVYNAFWSVLEEAADAVLDAETGLDGYTVTEVQQADATLYKSIGLAIAHAGMIREIV